MKILILAQIPPPYHGQLIMQQYLVNATWEWCEKIFVQLDFSKSAAEVGNFRFNKIFRLINIVIKVWRIRLKGKPDIIFYPPSGPHKIPFYRDVLILVFTRWCTRKIVFQFHAGGFDILLKKLNPIEKHLAHIAYKNANATIILSPKFKDEIKWIKPKKVYVVPNGIKDHFKFSTAVKSNINDTAILTVGMISEAKGIFISIETARILKEKNYKFIWNFIGSFQSVELKQEIESKILKYGLMDFVNFPGSLFGKEKISIYSNADLFCFPSFDNEAMPLVLLEAMMMSLPIVATNWRGIPDVIDNKKNGLLVPIKDSIKLAEAIEKIINNRELRNKLAENARKKYLSEFTIEKHLKRMEDVFKEVAFDT
ncbi:MAG: glycosyltransferase family 4 protein [Ignavibacteriaceae bacterium]